MDQYLYKKIIWFGKRAKFDIDFFDILQPQRKVSVHHRYKSGLFYSEKCKRNIQYESGLELAFIKQLEYSKKVKFYYEQPVRIEYWRGRRKQLYTPDFGLYLNTNEFVLVEIKDLPSMLESHVQAKTEALLGFCSGKGFGLLLTDGKYTIDKLRKVRYNYKLERHLLKAINNNILRGKQYLEIMRNCPHSQSELLKVVIKHNLRYKTFPFRLQHENENKIFRQVFIEKKRYEDLPAERYPALFK